MSNAAATAATSVPSVVIMRTSHEKKKKKHKHHWRHEDSSGCYMWIWFLLILVFISIFLIPLIICWTGNCSSSSGKQVPMSSMGTLIHGGAGGHPIEGLRNYGGGGGGASACGPGDVYNTSMQVCQPRLLYPRTMNQDLIDMGTETCSSFFKHACGEFLQFHAGKSADRSFSAAWRANQYALEHIVRDATEGPIYAFYKSCIETLVNGNYVQETTMAIHLLQDAILTPDISLLFARLISHGFTAPFAVFAERHPTDAQWSTVLRFSYDNFPEAHTEVSFIQNLFLTANPTMIPQIAQRRAQELSEFLKTLAAHAPVYEPAGLTFLEYLRSGIKRDLYTWVDMELVSKTRFSWAIFFDALALPLPKSYWPTWIQDMTYFQWLFGGILQQTPTSVLRTYAEYSILYHTFRFMPNVHGQGHNSFRFMPIEQRNRRSSGVYSEQQCVHATQHMLPGQVAKAYLTRRGGDTIVEPIIARVREMTNKIIQQYIKRVSSTTWMSAEDKRRAVHKLRNIVVRIGHPTDPAWSASEAFAEHGMRPDQYVQNVNQVQSFRMAQQLVDWKNGPMFYNRTALDSESARSARDALAKFGIPLSMVNAFYDPSSNTITVPLGILQAPFFDVRFDEISAYATMGSVIGHELAHAFDPVGLYFDSHGAFHTLGPWTKASMTAYTEQASCILSEYSVHADLEQCFAIKATKSAKRDAYAERVLGEAMADVVGTRLAFEAALGESGEMTSQRMAQAHAFFYSYAQMWCSVTTQQDMCNQMTHDVHAIADMRVDYTLRQLPQYFAAAFRCGEGTPMRGGGGKAPCTVF